MSEAFQYKVIVDGSMFNDVMAHLKDLYGFGGKNKIWRYSGMRYDHTDVFIFSCPEVAMELKLRFG